MNNTQHFRGRFALIGIPYLWLFIFFLLPFFIVFKISLSELAIAQPPYTPVFDFAAGWGGIKDFLSRLSFNNYVFLTTDELYIDSYLSSLKISAISTVITLAVGFPIAYGMAKAPRSWQPTLLMLIILPFWTSFLIRVYAWIGILKPEGLLNQLLLWLGVINEPLIIINTNYAVYIGIVYSYLPFMVLPLYSTLERMDVSLIEAARDLGCTQLKAFWVVTLPLAIPGIIAGCFLVFIPSVGEFVIPDILGGSDTLMIGRTLWTEFFNNRDWPVSSSVAIVMLVLLIVPIILFQKIQEKEMEAV